MPEKAGKQFFSKQNNPVAHLFTNLFYKVIGQHQNLILCCKGRYRRRELMNFSA